MQLSVSEISSAKVSEWWVNVPEISSTEIFESGVFQRADHSQFLSLLDFLPQSDLFCFDSV